MTQFLLIAAAIPLLGFSICYGLFSPWWRTLQGQLLLVQKIVMFAVFLFWMLPTFPGRDTVRIVLISILAALFWAMFVRLIWVQTTTKPVTRRTGTGLLPPEDIEITDPRYTRPTSRRNQ